MNENDDTIKSTEKNTSPTIAKQLIAKIGGFFQRFQLFTDRVSTVHLEEAHERYWILWRDIEAVLQENAHHLQFQFVYLAKNVARDEELIDRYFHDVETQLKSLPQDSQNRENCIDKILEVLPYYKLMAKDRQLLNRSARDLSVLWQDMNFIRIRLLNQIYIKKPEFNLALYLDFCREDAHGLRVQDQPEIKEALHNAALSLVEGQDTGNETTQPGSRQQAIRNISTILAKLKRLRLETFHAQLQKRNAYISALGVLLLLAAILIYGSDVFLATATQTTPTIDRTAPGNFFSHLNPIGQILLSIPLLPWIVMDSLTRTITSDPLLFIFFSGLVGGYFSAVMKLQTQTDHAGEWAYYKWYMFTKPFIGALGAAILYITLKANFLELQNILGSESLQPILYQPISAKGFIFGFILGFSERIILPQIGKGKT